LSTAYEDTLPASSQAPTACVNDTITQPVNMQYHMRLAYPTACDFSRYKYSFFLPEQHYISQPPSIGGDFVGLDFTKYKGGDFDLDFLERGCQKRLVYVPIASICSLMLN
jgi:hypothetical protein